MSDELPETVSDNSSPPKRGRGRPKMRGVELALREMARASLPGHTERSVRNHERADGVLGLIEHHAPEIADRFKTGSRIKTTVLVALARLPMEWWLAYARELAENSDYTAREDVTWLRGEYNRRIDEIRKIEQAGKDEFNGEPTCSKAHCFKPREGDSEFCRRHGRSAARGRGTP